MIGKCIRKLRFLTQRIFWGFDERDLWSLDYTLAKWILPRLIKFKEVADGGIPCNLENHNLGPDYTSEEFLKAKQEWRYVQNKIISAFRLIIKDVDGSILSEEEQKEMDEGLDLFRKYLRNLWW